MSYPNSYKSFRRTAGDLPNTIEMSEETLPRDLGPTDVVIKVHAVSLNYRDVAMLIGTYPVPYRQHGIPASDCAAEVVAIGLGVKSFRIGDAVAPITGIGKYEEFDDGFSEALGADTEGVLREYAVFDQKHLVHLPGSMSWEEVSTPAVDMGHSKTLDLLVLRGLCFLVPV
jgi:NADPH:quinone reductase-like Zn-dependent oxidoreductase